MRVVARFGSDFLELSGSSQHMLVCRKFAFNDGANDDEGKEGCFYEKSFQGTILFQHKLQLVNIFQCTFLAYCGT